MKKYLLIFSILLLPLKLMAMSIDGDDNDWISASELTVISTNSVIVKSTDSLNEWIWKDKTGDQSKTGKPDLTEFRVKSNGTNLYFLAKFENLKLGTTDYVTPMLQIAISYADEGSYMFMDFNDVRNEEVSKDAYWENLWSLYQPTPSTKTVYTNNSDIRWYKTLSAGTIQKGWEGELAIYRVIASSTGFFEAGIPFSDIGSADAYKSRTVNFTVALFENAGATGGTLGNGTSDGIIDCVSLKSTVEEKSDDGDDIVIDTYMGIRFDGSGKIASNTAPSKITRANIKIDGKTENNDVVVVDRTPVFSWSFEDDDSSDIQKAVNIEITDTNNTTIADFTELVEEDVFRVNYPASLSELQPEKTYYLRIRVMDSIGTYSGWSDTVAFKTVQPAIDIDEGKIDLKIDWNNPFYGGEITKIRYNIPGEIDEEIFLGIYTVSGRLVRVLIDGEIKLSGVIHTEYWNGKDDTGSAVGSGTYIVHLRAGDVYKTVKVCFIK